MLRNAKIWTHSTIEISLEHIALSEMYQSQKTSCSWSHLDVVRKSIEEGGRVLFAKGSVQGNMESYRFMGPVSILQDEKVPELDMRVVQQREFIWFHQLHTYKWLTCSIMLCVSY